MKPEILDDKEFIENYCANTIIDDSTFYLTNFDLSIKFVQHDCSFKQIPKRIGRIIDLYDLTDKISCCEESSCLLVTIKDEYKQSFSFPLLKIKRLANSLNRFLQYVGSPDSYIAIEVYRGNCSGNPNNEMVYNDFVTPYHTINVSKLAAFIYMLPILFKCK